MKPLARAAVAAGAAGIASAAYQRAAEAADRRRFPPPGQLLDVGGRRMHILTEGAGSPAVVIVPALGSNVLEWVRIQRAASAGTAICVYDRAGIGWSDPPRGRVTIDGMASDLHALLGAAGIGSPYVMAGQSMGGIVARRFQARYPGEVAGMLLVDSSHEDQARRFGWRQGVWPNLKLAAQRRARVLGARRIAAGLGLVPSLAAASLDWETVPEHTDAARAIALSSHDRDIAVREMLLLARPQGQPQDLRSLPLTVISAASPRRREWPSWQVWMEMQAEFAALSDDAVHIAALNADHNVHLDDPELVAQAIRDLVDRCRLRPFSRRVCPVWSVAGQAVSVTAAYARLFAEGWLEGRHGSGTYVADVAPATQTPAAPAPIPARRRESAVITAPGVMTALSCGGGSAGLIELQTVVPWTAGIDPAVSRGRGRGGGLPPGRWRRRPHPSRGFAGCR